MTLSTSAEEFVIWDRKEKGGFPGCHPESLADYRDEGVEAACP